MQQKPLPSFAAPLYVCLQCGSEAAEAKNLCVPMRKPFGELRKSSGG